MTDDQQVGRLLAQLPERARSISRTYYLVSFGSKDRFVRDSRGLIMIDEEDDQFGA